MSGATANPLTGPSRWRTSRRCCRARAGAGRGRRGSYRGAPGAATWRSCTGVLATDRSRPPPSRPAPCWSSRPRRRCAGADGGLPDRAQPGGAGAARRLSGGGRRPAQGLGLRPAADGGRAAGLGRGPRGPRSPATLAPYDPDAVVVFDVDLGHTDPQLIIPYGGEIRVDAGSSAASRCATEICAPPGPAGGAPIPDQSFAADDRSQGGVRKARRLDGTGSCPWTLPGRCRRRFRPGRVCRERSRPGRRAAGEARPAAVGRPHSDRARRARQRHPLHPQAVLARRIAHRHDGLQLSLLVPARAVVRRAIGVDAPEGRIACATDPPALRAIFFKTVTLPRVTGRRRRRRGPGRCPCRPPSAGPR